MVLNDSPLAQNLTPQTRERVLAGARELGYKANYFARMLNNKRSNMVGILSPDLGEGYDSEILNGIEQALIERDYLYFVSSHHWKPELVEQRLNVFTERGAEGMVLINTPVSSPRKLPMVMIGSTVTDYPMTRISIDNAHGVQLAIKHLYELGHRDFAFLKGHTLSSDTLDRWSACESTARELGIVIHDDQVVQLERIDNGLNPIREGWIAARELMRLERKFTALFTFNDLSAIGAIHALKEAGIRVPEDVSVVGFDDVQAASIVEPRLTTIKQPLTKMGIMAAKEVLSQIETPDSEQRVILIKPELVLRNSTAPPPLNGRVH